jgi:hypothetical protein
LATATGGPGASGERSISRTTPTLSPAWWVRKVLTEPGIANERVAPSTLAVAFGTE